MAAALVELLPHDFAVGVHDEVFHKSHIARLETDSLVGKFALRIGFQVADFGADRTGGVVPPVFKQDFVKNQLPPVRATVGDFGFAIADCGLATGCTPFSPDVSGRADCEKSGAAASARAKTRVFFM